MHPHSQPGSKTWRNRDDDQHRVDVRPRQDPGRTMPTPHSQQLTAGARPGDASRGSTAAWPSSASAWDDNFDYDEEAVDTVPPPLPSFLAEPSHRTVSPSGNESEATLDPNGQATPTPSYAAEGDTETGIRQSSSVAGEVRHAAAASNQPRRPKPVHLATVLRALIGRDVVVDLLDLPENRGLQVSNPAAHYTHEIADAQMKLRERFGYATPQMVVNPQIQQEILQYSEALSNPLAAGAASAPTTTSTALKSLAPSAWGWPIAEVRGTLESAADDHTITLVNVEIRAVTAALRSTVQADTPTSKCETVLYGKWIKCQPVRIPGSRVGAIKLPNGTDVVKLLTRHQKELEAIQRKQQRGIRRGPMPGTAPASPQGSQSSQTLQTQKSAR